MKMKQSLALILLLLVVNSVFSQEYTLDKPKKLNETYSSPYNKAIGVKMYPSAISYKQFTKQNKAFEALGYFTLDGFRASVLFEKYSPIGDIENLSWYVGYGGHLGLWSEEWKKSNPNHKAGIALGVDGILGIDYKIKTAPLNLSIDWQPSFNFVGSSYFESGWAGIGVRYTF
jgi:hypothetical protein